MEKQSLELFDSKDKTIIKIAGHEIPYVVGYSVAHNLGDVVHLSLDLDIPVEVIALALDDCELK